MTVQELRELIGKTVTEIEYEPGEFTAYIVTRDGTGLEVVVEPTEEEEEV